MNLKRIILIPFCLSILIRIASAETHTVVVGPNNNDVFAPANITINVGDTVRWTFADDGHTVTSSTGNNCSRSGLFDSGLVDSGAEFSFVFNEAGTFNYMCIPHCDDGMRGVIEVVGWKSLRMILTFRYQHQLWLLAIKMSALSKPKA